MANKGINKVIIVGNVGKDPEVKTFQNGGTLVNATVATSENWKDKTSGEQIERTEWHKLVFNGKLSEIAANYIRKGSKIYVEGKLKTRKWKDNEGIERYVTEIVVEQFQMLDARKGAEPDGNVGNQRGLPMSSGFDDDIPF